MQCENHLNHFSVFSLSNFDGALKGQKFKYSLFFFDIHKQTCGLNESTWQYFQWMFVENFHLNVSKKRIQFDQMWLQKTAEKTHSQKNFVYFSYTFYRIQCVRKKNCVCFLFTCQTSTHLRKKKNRTQIRFWASKYVIYCTLFLILSEVIDCSCSLAKIVLFSGFKTDNIAGWNQNKRRTAMKC